MGRPFLPSPAMMAGLRKEYFRLAPITSYTSSRHGGRGLPPPRKQLMSVTSTAIRSPFLSNPDKAHFIEGKWQPSATGERIQTFNPATGQVLATLARGRKEDVDSAVSSARRAFEGPWSRFTPHQRYSLMLRVCEIL